MANKLKKIFSNKLIQSIITYASLLFIMLFIIIDLLYNMPKIIIILLSFIAILCILMISYSYIITTSTLYEIEKIYKEKEIKVCELQNKLDENTTRLDELLGLDKLKTESIANLAHEFRTPLNVILAAIQLNQLYINDIKQTNIKKVYSNHKIVKQNCYRLLRLINNLIDSTKIDAGFYKINLVNCNIVSIVEDITMSVAEYTKCKGINLIFDTEIEERIMACDPDKIERIILNLLSNAIKFTKEKGTIKVNIFDNDEVVKISILDSGVGIPKDKQETIFERFKQVEKNQSKSNEGSGIGLSLVKSLIEMHQGKIYVSSKYGEGSEFIIELPIRLIEEKNTFNDTSSNKLQGNHVERINIEFADIYTE